MGGATTLRVERFPSGAVYGYVLPNVQRLLLSGYFPQSVIPLVRQVVSSKVDDSRVQSDEEIDQWEQFKAHVVAWMIRTEGGEIRVVGEQADRAGLLAAATTGRKLAELFETEVVNTGDPVTYTPEQVLDPDRFPADDLAELFARGVRTVAAPKAVRLTT